MPMATGWPPTTVMTAEPSLMLNGEEPGPMLEAWADPAEPTAIAATELARTAEAARDLRRVGRMTRLLRVLMARRDDSRVLTLR